MKAVLFAFLLFFSLPASAQNGCVQYGSENESFLYRLCPGGVAYEKQYLYYGKWDDWTRMHPNVKPPCLWTPKDSAWHCMRRIITCTANACR